MCARSRNLAWALTMGSLGLCLVACVLATPIGLAAWFAFRRRFPRPRTLTALPMAAVELAGGVIGQAFGLALFAAAASYKSTGDVEFVNGIVGYGTVLFSPWSGVGVWVFAKAWGERTEHSARALVAACALALVAVVAFFGAASVFTLEGLGWMPVYALSPVIGALCGYRLGAFGMPLGFARLKRRGPDGGE